jgi:thioredoxin-like negative regulator of GroEL
MKTLALTAALLLSLTCTAHADIHESYDDAVLASLDDGRPLVVLVTAPAWCGPCRALEKTLGPMIDQGKFKDVHFYILDYDKETKLANQLDSKKRVPVMIKYTRVGTERRVNMLRGNQPVKQIQTFLGENSGPKQSFRLKR